MNKTKPWHDSPTHVVAGEICGHVTVPSPGVYRCATCGGAVDLNMRDRLRAERASAAWDDEENRRVCDEIRRREHDRLAPLLAEALARRREASQK